MVNQGEKRKLQKSVNSAQKKNAQGSLIKKQPGKEPKKTKPRPPLDLSKLDLTKWTKNMPLDKFFADVVLHETNKKVFVAERNKPREGKRRNIIHSLLSLYELTYGKKIENCVSDVDCIKDMLSSSLLTKENYLSVFESLSHVITEILFTPNDNKMEQNYRSKLLSVTTDSHAWFDNAHKASAKGVFTQDKLSLELLATERKSKKITGLQNVAMYSEYDLLTDIDILRDTIEAKENNWEFAALTLIQLALCTRWVEALVCGFEVSKQEQYPPSHYIIQRAQAKESSAISKKYQKKFNEFMESGGDASKFGDALGDDEKDDLEFVAKTVITKPVNFHEKKITPQFICDLIKAVRQELVEEHFENVPGIDNDEDLQKWINCDFIIESPEARAEFSRVLLGSSIRFITNLFGENSVVLKKNKTHSLRKLGASVSYRYYGGNTPQSLWYMQILGHEDIQTSSFYMTLQVDFGVRMIDRETIEGVLEMYSALKSEVHILREELAKVNNEEKGKIKLPTQDGGEVWLKLKHFDTNKLNDEEKKTRAQAFLEDLVSKNIDIKNLHFDAHLKSVMSRRSWKYFNKARFPYFNRL